MADKTIKLSLLPKTLTAADDHFLTQDHTIALIVKRNDIADILNGHLPISTNDFKMLIKYTEEAEYLTTDGKPIEVAEVAATFGPEDRDLYPTGTVIRNVVIAMKRLMEAMCKVQEIVYLLADTGAELWEFRSRPRDDSDKENSAPGIQYSVVKFEDLSEDLKRRAQAISSCNQLTSFDSLREEGERKQREEEAETLGRAV